MAQSVATPAAQESCVVSQESLPSWRIPAIDGFRALAMLMVLACHVWEFSRRPTLYIAPLGWRMEVFGAFSNGSRGVDLFMVLSGFCLFLPVCKSESALARFDWRSFYRRRIRRIVPPYYAAIAFATLLPYALVLAFRLMHSPAKWQPPPGTPYAYVAHLLFIHTLSLRSRGQINASLWSMGLEAQFYLMFPLVVLAFRRFRLHAIGMMIGVSLAYNLFMEFYTQTMPFAERNLYFIFFLGRWIEFAAGMFAAWIVASHRRQDRWHSTRRGSLGVIIALLLYTIAASCAFPLYLGWAPMALMATAFALAIISVCITRSPFGCLLSNPVMDRLGYISYSFFLVHWPVVYYMGEALLRLHLQGGTLFFMLLSGGFAATLIIAYGFFLLFEKPFLNAPTPARRREAALMA